MYYYYVSFFFVCYAIIKLILVKASTHSNKKKTDHQTTAFNEKICSLENMSHLTAVAQQPIYIKPKRIYW